MSQKNEDEVRRSVQNAYQEILGRPADNGGLKAATDNIMKGYITIEELKKSFYQSDEYKKKNMYLQLSQDYKQRMITNIKTDIYNDYENGKLL